jgi:2-hydroxy-6-oxonona-2,4-dienedioate hydrolase
MTARVASYPLEAGGVQTRVLDCGSGTDTAVFIHGVGARADRWRSNLEPFAEAGYRCLAIDLPGHGFADKGADVPATVPDFSHFLADFLDEMEVARAVLCGTSLGGHIAAHFACEQPERVPALVLVGSLGLMPLADGVGDLISRSIQETDRESVARKFHLVFANSDALATEMIDEEFRINNSRGAADSFARLGAYFSLGINDHVVRERLATLSERIPTLLVWGAEDKVVAPDVGRTATKLLPGSKLLEIPDTGHAPYLERPEAFNRPVLKFLAATKAAGGQVVGANAGR